MKTLLLKPLDKLTPGERAFIVDMKNAQLCEKLFEMGVFPGDLVEIKENNAKRNSIRVVINNKTYNIVRQAAETIITNVVHFELCLN